MGTWQLGRQLPDGRFAATLEYDPQGRDEGEIDSKEVAGQSHLFMKAYDRCMEERRLVGTNFQKLPLPGIICVALSIELGMKALIYADKRSPKVGKQQVHLLTLLYDLMPEPAKGNLPLRIGMDSKQFNVHLAQVSNVFADLRYYYEKNKAFAIDTEFLRLLALAMEAEVAALRNGAAMELHQHATDAPEKR